MLAGVVVMMARCGGNGVIKSGRRTGIVFVRLVNEKGGEGMVRRRRRMMKRKMGRTMLRVLVLVPVPHLRLALICILGVIVVTVPLLGLFRTRRMTKTREESLARKRERRGTRISMRGGRGGGFMLSCRTI